MKPKSLLRWARTTLLGHIILCDIIAGLPLALVFLALFYSDGTLTLDWALHTVVACLIGMGAAGAFFWFAVTQPRFTKKK
jgi:hypothetical protein